MMPFGGGGRKAPPPLPPAPRLAEVSFGGTLEKQRRKRAQGRSSTLVSRGLLFQAPLIAGMELGTKTRLGE